MSEYIVKLPTYGAADEFFKTHEMPDMTLYGYPLTGEIVRCRDCKYAMAYAKAAYCDYMNHVVEIDGFCAWGVKKVVGE